MAIRDELDITDVLHLEQIKKKLKLKFSTKRLQELLDLNEKEDLTDDEKVRRFLSIPEDVPVDEYLRAKLNDKQIVTVRKFTKTL